VRIQAVVTDQRGLNLASLVGAIQAAYRTPQGRRVKVKIGQGVYIDGVPEGTLRLVDRPDPPPTPEHLAEAQRVTEGAPQ
jgi:hypothetical protein